MAIVKTLIVKGVARFLTDAYMSTIRSGIWNGNTIGVGYGGTGVTSAKGDQYTPVFLSASGLTPCSAAIPHTTKNLNINGANYAIYTTANSLPGFLAPTSYGSANQILATNSSANGFVWVSKPVSNVTTSAIVGSSDSATTQITTAQTNPFYNLLEGGSVTRSIQFTSSNITISSTKGGVISFTAASWSGAASGTNGTAGYMPAPTSAQRNQFLRGDGTWVSLNNYSLPLAAKDTRGGIKIGFTESGNNYAVKLSSEKAYVTVPTNALNTIGTVAAPSSSTKNQVWMTDTDGNPAWRDINTSYAATSFNTTKTLVVSTWQTVKDNIDTSLDAGTYAIQISYTKTGNDGYSMYASGIFSTCHASDGITDEIPLHVTNSKSGASWRPYARISENNLQITTNESSGEERQYTIKILKLI